VTCADREGNQNAVTIRVFQGEREMAADSKFLGQLDLVGIAQGAIAVDFGRNPKGAKWKISRACEAVHIAMLRSALIRSLQNFFGGSSNRTEISHERSDGSGLHRFSVCYRSARHPAITLGLVGRAGRYGKQFDIAGTTRRRCQVAGRGL